MYRSDCGVTVKMEHRCEITASAILCHTILFVDDCIYIIILYLTPPILWNSSLAPIEVCTILTVPTFMSDMSYFFQNMHYKTCSRAFDVTR